MNAGNLNQRVTIQSRSASVDSIGQPVETWATVAELWADVRYQRGLEAIKAGADVSVVNLSVRIRYRAGIDAGMRILHGSDVLDIQAVLPDAGRREYIDLACRKVV
jgi:SPP1 family predicted phage head-tail adaptor